ETIFKLGRFTVLSGGIDTEFVISKRPAQIQFVFELTPTPFFTLNFRGNSLDAKQTSALVTHGYFIFEERRVCFVSSRVIEHLKTAFEDLPLSKLIKLLRSLFQERLINEIPTDLLEKLRANQLKESHHEKLFVQSLYPYQESGVNWLSFCVENAVGTILADDMGLGKTAQVIALCCDVLEKNPDSKILIVIPNPLLDNWVREFSFFAPSITPYLHYGNQRRGVASAFDNSNVIITPYTTISSDITMFEDMYFDLALFDEASMLKNPKSGRSLSVRRLDVGVTVAMSGTPVENSLMDAWALSDLVFKGFLGSESDFKSIYVHSDISETLNKNLEELEGSLRQITLRRMKKDVLKQLPEKLDIHTAVSLGEKEAVCYDNIINEMKNDAGNGGGGILPLINKLQQFTAHPALLDSSIRHDIKTLKSNSAKFELLILQLDNIANSNEKVIIFATFQKAIDLIQGAIQERYKVSPGIIDGRTPNEDRQTLIDDFSASKGFDVLLLHPKTAGMGFNITAATNVIHYSRQWNPALEEQATARAWRNGQNKIVNVYYMYYANTIEEKIDERIRLKQQLSERVVSVTDNKETDKQIMLAYLETLAS
ncbi:MAG: DEAD/DEAH box helicase, partial [Endozoicomonadaceae bacterium]|nr:DEAD/DEAH box helicase [Endozoicomonadaceae bacterium]